jgi:hypothetical protein
MRTFQGLTGAQQMWCITSNVQPRAIGVENEDADMISTIQVDLLSLCIDRIVVTCAFVYVCNRMKCLWIRPIIFDYMWQLSWTLLQVVWVVIC